MGLKEKIKGDLAPFKKIKNRKLPSFSQWRQVFKVLSKKEKIIFFIFLTFALASGIYLVATLYYQNTQIAPAWGGSYKEGIVGQPRLLNPIYASVSDVDRDLVEILFSGLFKYNQRGEIVPDLAEDFQTRGEGKIYEINLRENAFWHDGTSVTADDVVFTIKTIQNPDYKSPLRAIWLGVKVEKISNQKILFELENSYAPFLENLTLKILPKHIWENIPAQSFPLAALNLEPIGSGPYQLKKTSQDKLGKIKSLEVSRFKHYFGKKPYIPKIIFYFFETEADLIKAAKNGVVDGLSLLSLKNSDVVKKKDLAKYTLLMPRYFALFLNPQKSKVLTEKDVREALSYAVNKEEILQEVLKSEAKLVDSPILPDIFGFPQPEKTYNFNLEKAKEILEKAGFKEKEGTCQPTTSELTDKAGQESEGKCQLGLREKIIKKTEAVIFKSELKLGSQGKEVTELQKCLAQDSEIYPESEITGYFGPITRNAVIKFQEKYAKEILEPWGFQKGTGIVSKTTREKLNAVCGPTPEETLALKFSLVTVDQPEMKEVAELLKKQWAEIGAEVSIKTVKSFELEQDFLKPRNYESLLFGEVLGSIPDPFPFWHSSQKKDPGLNLAQYENKKADKLLEEARQSLEPEIIAEKLSLFQNILIEDVPAIFLYNPNYLYWVSDKIKGIDLKMIVDPSKRFAEIENWYIDAKRTWR